MPESASVLTSVPRRTRLPLPPAPLAGFVLAIAALILITFARYRSLQIEAASAAEVAHTLEVIDEAQEVLADATNAETGQRGYLLSGDDAYLEPYTRSSEALGRELVDLSLLTRGDARQQLRVQELQRAVQQKLAELVQTIALRRRGETTAAIGVLRTDRGKTMMDTIRETIGAMVDDERRALSTRQAGLRAATLSSYRVSMGGSALLLVLIGAAAVTTARDYRARQRQGWIRAGLAQFGMRIQGEQRLESLGDEILQFLARYLDAQIGAAYLLQPSGSLRRFAGYALSRSDASDLVHSGEGLLGEAAKQGRTLHVTAVPKDYRPVSSSLGKSGPRELVITPATVDGRVNAIIELGFFRHVAPQDLELLAGVAEALGVTVRAAHDRTRLEELLAETQRQAEELQQQQEELRVTNEELEVQSKALKESQGRLEVQQVELEQTNMQLEEQTQALQDQRDALADTQAALIAKASELERSSQYKSEFLANMSHELRTPLNSALILAKILADNKAGNLSPEQVKYANTILSAGNELLALINDVLDLARIEAGRVEVHAQPVRVTQMLEELSSGFEALARQRGLAFSVATQPGVPEMIETDPQRLGQILKNLVANALKFTERGEVVVAARPAAGGKVHFSVRDTGIGIAADRHGIIFQAFRQADGSTHRRYGGTGLGLSISRDLARLLGGDIALESAEGAGSTFTLELPIHFQPVPRPVAAEAGVHPAAPRTGIARAAAPTTQTTVTTVTPLPTAPAVSAAAQAARAALPPFIADDRARITRESRVVLVVEDDARFAEILRDLSRERGYHCIATSTGLAALAAVEQYAPLAVLLDLKLPDASGMQVLEQLKGDSRTRHIPVHVVSAADQAQEALARGAVGYLRKPAQREGLLEAFEKLEQTLAQRVRRVLVVEADPEQCASITELLANEDVQVSGAASAAQALQELARSTFDCLVVDLDLPDMAGEALLERMAQQEGVAFPPVIVYTAGALTPEQEQRLRRFSSSIIIKDVRSPERLLDEVTLFLHQVETRLPPERRRMLNAARDPETALAGRRVLVVEDDVRNIFALSSLLEPKGVKISIARNGREALEALERTHGASGEPIDLVLMDLMMPEMDGFTAMREIRKRREWQRLPIIALTAKAMQDDREQSLAAGASDYIAKPLDVDKLLQLIRVWMPR